MTYFTQWPMLLFMGMVVTFLLTLGVVTMLDRRNG